MPTCGAVQSPTFQPAMRIISAITKAQQAEVTTTFAHNYTTGLIVRLYVPRTYGMTQANKFSGPITVTSDITFTMNLDSTGFDTFFVPPGNTAAEDQFCSTVVPIADSFLNQAMRNVL